MTTTSPDLTLHTAHLPDVIRRTARLHRSELDALTEHLLDCAADHVDTHPDHADDCLALATVERLKHYHGEDPLDDPIIRDIARLRVRLAPFHPDAEEMIE